MDYPKRIRTTVRDVDGKEYTAGLDVISAHEESCVKDGSAKLQVVHNAGGKDAVQIRVLSIPQKKTPPKAARRRFQED